MHRDEEAPLVIDIYLPCRSGKVIAGYLQRHHRVSAKLSVGHLNHSVERHDSATRGAPAELIEWSSNIHDA